MGLTTALLACSSSEHPKISGETVLDAIVPLTRGAQWDSATLGLHATPGATLVVFVHEQGTDVKLRIRAGRDAIEVESNLQGESLEIAVIKVPLTGRLTADLQGPRDGELPGRVRVVAQSFGPSALREEPARTRLAAYLAWGRATRAGLTAQEVPLAIPQIDTAIAALESPSNGDPALAAMARLVRARMLYYHEIDWVESRNEARRAAAAFAASDVADARNTARSRRLEAAALQELALDRTATNPTAHEADAEARRIYGELAAETSALDAVGRARTRNFLGLMDLNVQAWAEAEAHFQAALRQYHAARFRAGALQTLRNLALLANYRGDYSAAAHTYQALVAEIDVLSDWEARATLLINAATADTNAGNSDRAIERFLRAEQIAKERHLPPAHARALHGLGVAYWARGDLTQAKSFFDRSLTMQQSLADSVGMFGSLRSVGALMRDSGDATRALELHHEAATLAPNPLALIRAHVEIARDHVALERLGEALKACREAVAVPLEDPNHPVRREARLVLAEILTMNRTRPLAQTREAERLAREAARLAESTADLQTEITARRVLARLLVERKQRILARQELERAIELVFKYSRSSSNPELQASTRFSHSQVFRDYLDLQMLDAATPAARQRALRVLEMVRALNFTLEPGERGSAKLTAELTTLLDQLAARHVRIAALRERATPPEGDIDALQLDMARLRAQIDRVRTARGESHSVTSNEASAWPAEWRFTDAGTAQLSYSAAGARGYLWRRDATGMRAWVLAASGDAIRRLIASAARVDPLQSPAAYDHAIVQLSTLLLPPDAITKAHTRIEISADAELSLIPFAALQSPTDPTRRLAETHVISIVPSLLRRATETASTPRRWRLVALDGARGAHSGGARVQEARLFPALPGASLEVSRISASLSAGASSPPDPNRRRQQVLRGAEATAVAIQAAMQQGVEVMHFATHGLADLRHPLASLLWLPAAPGEHKQSYLTAGQIQSWRGDVGLVFLSACETAVGPTRFAEGMPGLQRAFLRAGAEHVIATLWAVEDSLAAEFAQQFYAELARGIDAPEALARTQRAWVRSATDESEQKSMRRRVAAWGYVLYSR